MEKNREYDNYRFEKESDGCWYVVLPDYPGIHADLQMVSGADTMLDIMAQGESFVEVVLGTKQFEDSVPLTFIKPEEGEGGWYLMKEWKGISYELELWLCDVTQYVFGEFPKVIYVG